MGIACTTKDVREAVMTITSDLDTSEEGPFEGVNVQISHRISFNLLQVNNEQVLTYFAFVVNKSESSFTSYKHPVVRMWVVFTLLEFSKIR